MGILSFFKNIFKSNSNANPTSAINGRAPIPCPITFDERKKTTNPSARGLYIAEIMLLKYCSYGTYPNPKNGYPVFWWYTYGIKDIDAVLDSLAERGFIRLSSASESIAKLTVSQLKEILTSYALPINGKKADLVLRLQQNLSEDKLLPYTPARKYTLTELGADELSQNDYVPQLHRSSKFGVDVWQVNEYLGTHPGGNWRDCIWGELNRRLLEVSNRNEYISVKHDMCDFLMEEDRFNDALIALSDAAFYDISSTAVNEYKTMLAYSVSTTYENTLCFFCHYSQKFKQICEHLGFTAENLQNEVLASLRRIQGSPDLFSLNDIARLIASGSVGPIEEFSRLCQKMERAIRASIPNLPALRAKQKASETDVELYKLSRELKMQDAQLNAIRNAEGRYGVDNDVEKLIIFWESIWENGGLIFNGTIWLFRLPDLYIEQKRYNDALRILGMITNPSEQDRVQEYIERIFALR